MTMIINTCYNSSSDTMVPITSLQEIVLDSSPEFQEAGQYPKKLHEGYYLVKQFESYVVHGEKWVMIISKTHSNI